MSLRASPKVVHRILVRSSSRLWAFSGALLLFCVTTPVAKAQPSIKAHPGIVTPRKPPQANAEHAALTTREAVNTVYAELGGAGVFLTANYERTVTEDVSFRIGAGYGPPRSFFVPLTASYHGIGSLTSNLELGLGMTFMSWDNSGTRTDAVAALLFAGYRYQPPGGGFFFRVGANLLFEEQAFREITSSGVLPWPYLALGGTFGR